MNPITWVQGLNGTTLIVAICVLMFIEETSLPLPFAPGDIVLAIGGISVAGGRVNPAMLVGAVAVRITIGAVIGLEAAGLLGWERLITLITGATLLAMAQPVGALAGHLPTFMPPPGCTGGWNTFQSAEHNHAPGTSPGCTWRISARHRAPYAGSSVRRGGSAPARVHVIDATRQANSSAS